jgi:hypothetical protein
MTTSNLVIINFITYFKASNAKFSQTLSRGFADETCKNLGHGCVQTGLILHSFMEHKVYIKLRDINRDMLT